MLKTACWLGLAWLGVVWAGLAGRHMTAGRCVVVVVAVVIVVPSRISSGFATAGGMGEGVLGMTR